MGLLTKKVLITVKTYPTLSSTYGELVCTAGLTEDCSWIRIYPIPFRRLKEYYRFEKYTWIELSLEKNRQDPRPESFRPKDLAKIKHLSHMGTARDWWERRQLVLKKIPIYDDIDLLVEKAKSNELSLALFKPSKIEDFIWEEVEREWDAVKLKKVIKELSQRYLFPQEEFLEDFEIALKLPYKFSYVFYDAKGKKCTLMIEDWEVGALYWNCLKQYKSESRALEKVKHKYYTIFTEKNDIYFYLGTTRQWHNVAPNPFVIVGLFAPPKTSQRDLDFG